MTVSETEAPMEFSEGVHKRTWSVPVAPGHHLANHALGAHPAE